MTLNDLLADLYRRLKYGTSPPTAVTTRLTAFLQDRHRDLLSMPGMSEFRQGLITLTSTSGTYLYGLPPAVGRILAITQRSGQMPLSEVSLDEIRRIDPALTQTGSCAELFCIMGRRPVASQPSDASEIFIKSTSASDTGTAYLEGIRTGGYPVRLSVTMTGVTAVSLGTAYTDIIEITNVYISVAAVGTVTVHEDSGSGTELARIPIGRLESRYLGILLWPAPAGETYHIDYERNLEFDLTNATDEPALPLDFHRLLRLGAQADEYEYLQDDRLQVARTDYEAGIRQMKAWLHTRPTYAPIPRRERRRSQLGPQFGSGT